MKNYLKDKREPFKHLSGYTNEYLSEMFSNVKSPCFIIDEEGLTENGKILKAVSDKSGARILLAQKAFSNYDFYPLLSEYLSGTEASGLFEARLGAEEMPGKEVHVFSAAFRDDEIDEVLKYADHIVFNSIAQLKKFGHLVKEKDKSVGLRINPEHSTQDGHEIYDPCAPGSRMGVTKAVWEKEMTDECFSMLDGLHFHTLCEQDADALYETVEIVLKNFGEYIRSLKWINIGGGHHITRDGYDRELFIKTVKKIQNEYGVKVYAEPGEAVALNAGYLLTRVLDIVENGDIRILILDMSPACHTPDVIEMPYMPPLYGAIKAGEGEGIKYRLAGPSCLTGDVIGDYVFPCEIKTGDMLLFGDMAIYSTCKTNTFNGMPLPAIKKLKDGKISDIVSFRYEDFKKRLGK